MVIMMPAAMAAVCNAKWVRFDFSEWLAQGLFLLITVCVFVVVCVVVCNYVSQSDTTNYLFIN